MTPAQRRAMLRAELDRAIIDAREIAATFARLLSEKPVPPPVALEEAANEVVLKAGRVAGFAHLLARTK